ncbi:MAG: hypothetical protein SNJ78_01120 [Spirochaetales bacterium]
MTEWEERKFQEVYDTVYTTTRYRIVTDPNFTIKDLERILQTLYTNDGNDQGGRGRVADIISSATIAAHQQVLLEWKRELEKEL